MLKNINAEASIERRLTMVVTLVTLDTLDNRRVR